MKLERVTKTTKLVVFFLLVQEEKTWGLEIARKTGLSTGTAYPLLARLENLGWVQSQWEADQHRVGPRRKYYSLTFEGIMAAKALAQKEEEVRKGRRGEKYA